MARSSVEIVVVLLHVFAVIAFAVSESEEALFQDGILAVPKREGKAKPLLLVANACQAVFTPAIGAAAGMVMGKVVPRVSVGGVVFPHRTPLPLAEVGTPKSVAYGHGC